MKRRDLNQKIDILIMDDESEFHLQMQSMLDSFIFQNKKIRLISAFNNSQALSQIKEKAIAVAFIKLEAVANPAGIELVDEIRNGIKNKDIRIILVTEPNGAVSEFEIVSNYDIDGFPEKSDFNKDRLFSILTIALRGYRRIEQIRDHNVRMKLLRQFSKQHVQFKGISYLINAVYNFLTKEKHIESIAIYKNGKIQHCNGDKTRFNKIYSAWEKSDSEIIESHFIMRVREFENHVIVVQSKTSYEETSKHYSINIVEQALAARRNIINVIKNDRLLSDLYYISTNAYKIVSVEAKGGNVLLHMIGNKPELVNQQIKAVSLFFNDTFLLQINRSVLINVKNIKNINHISSRKITVEMVTKQIFPVSRSNLEKVERLGEYQ